MKIVGRQDEDGVCLFIQFSGDFMNGIAVSEPLLSGRTLATNSGLFVGILNPFMRSEK